MASTLLALLALTMVGEHMTFARLEGGSLLGEAGPKALHGNCGKNCACIGNCAFAVENAPNVLCGKTKVDVTAGTSVEVQTICAPPTVKSLNGCRIERRVIPSYGPEAVLAVTRARFNANNVSFTDKFRVLENMIEEGKDSKTVDFSWTFTCPENSTTDQMAFRAIYNLTIVALPAVPRSSAWKPPQSPLNLGCLIAGKTHQLRLEFSNQSATSRPLKSWPGARFPLPSASPTLYSRPSGIGWSSEGKDLVRSIVPEGSGNLLLSLYARSPQDGQRRVCIYPGDDYNYYRKICTMPFAVVRDADECITTTTTRFLSSSSEISHGIFPLLVMILLMAGVP